MSWEVIGNHGLVIIHKIASKLPPDPRLKVKLGHKVEFLVFCSASTKILPGMLSNLKFVRSIHTYGDMAFYCVDTSYLIGSGGIVYRNQNCLPGL